MQFKPGGKTKKRLITAALKDLGQTPGIPYSYKPKGGLLPTEVVTKLYEEDFYKLNRSHSKDGRMKASTAKSRLNQHLVNQQILAGLDETRKERAAKKAKPQPIEQHWV